MPDTYNISSGMNVLVTGANGQLGMEIRNVSAGGSHNFVFTDVTDAEGVVTGHLDITDLDAVSRCVAENCVDVIVNCAAYNEVERAEQDVAAAGLLNCDAAGNLALAARSRGAVLIHLSSDYVFDGEACVPYTETCATSPLGVYGKTKLDGEEAVLKSGCASMIFRTSWLYSPYGKNFVKTIRSLVCEKDSIDVVFDQVGTPTYAADLAGLIFKVIDGNMLSRTGIYHFSDEGACSWYDFAVAIQDLSGFGNSGNAAMEHICEIRPCHSDEFPSNVLRPHYSVLDKTKVRDTFSVSISHWTQSLKKCIARMDG